MLKRIAHVQIGVVLCFLLGFVGSAAAAGLALPTPDASWLDLSRPVLDAVLAGHGWIAAASFLILAVSVVRKVFPANKFLQSPTGAILLVFGGSYGAAVIAALGSAGTTALTGALAYAAAKVALAAAGGFATLRPLLVDIVEPFVVRRFPFLTPVMDLLTYFFDKPNAITATATIAGNAAVTAAPSAGVVGAIGAPTEIK